MLAKESKVCVAVMDLEKACERTKWEAMWELLKGRTWSRQKGTEGSDNI